MRLVIALILAVFAVSVASAQEKLPVIKSTSSIVSIQDGEQYRANIWRLVPEIKPDVYEAQLKDGKPHRVTFITDLESISFWVELGKKYDFIIQRGDDLCYTQILGVKYTPAAVFDQKYQIDVSREDDRRDTGSLRVGEHRDRDDADRYRRSKPGLQRL